MDYIFGKEEKKNERQIQREQKRGIEKEARTMEKEKQRLQQEEQKMVSEMKNALRKGDQYSAKLIAKNIVQVREQQQRLTKMGSTMNAMKYKATTAGANQTLLNSMAKTNKVMDSVNAKMDPKQMNDVMMNFQKQNAKMDISDEMLDDLMDGLGEEDEEEVDNAVSQVLDEIGVETSNKLDSIQTGKTTLKKQEEKSDPETEKLLKELGIKM
eukprot:gene9938-2259_t